MGQRLSMSSEAHVGLRTRCELLLLTIEAGLAMRTPSHTVPSLSAPSNLWGFEMLGPCQGVPVGSTGVREARESQLLAGAAERRRLRSLRLPEPSWTGVDAPHHVTPTTPVEAFDTNLAATGGAVHGPSEDGASTSTQASQSSQLVTGNSALDALLDDALEEALYG